MKGNAKHNSSLTIESECSLYDYPSHSGSNCSKDSDPEYSNDEHSNDGYPQYSDDQSREIIDDHCNYSDDQPYYYSDD